MAYVTICQPCLDGRHDECLVSWNKPADPNALGGAHCVCAHGGEESKFQRSVREGLEQRRKENLGGNA